MHSNAAHFSDCFTKCQFELSFLKQPEFKSEFVKVNVEFIYFLEFQMNCKMKQRIS